MATFLELAGTLSHKEASHYTDKSSQSAMQSAKNEIQISPGHAGEIPSQFGDFVSILVGGIRSDAVDLYNTTSSAFSSGVRVVLKPLEAMALATESVFNPDFGMMVLEPPEAQRDDRDDGDGDDGDDGDNDSDAAKASAPCATVGLPTPRTPPRLAVKRRGKGQRLGAVRLSITPERAKGNGTAPAAPSTGGNDGDGGGGGGDGSGGGGGRGFSTASTAAAAGISGALLAAADVVAQQRSPVNGLAALPRVEGAAKTLASLTAGGSEKAVPLSAAGTAAKKASTRVRLGSHVNLGRLKVRGGSAGSTQLFACRSGAWLLVGGQRLVYIAPNPTPETPWRGTVTWGASFAEIEGVTASLADADEAGRMAATSAAPLMPAAAAAAAATAADAGDDRTAGTDSGEGAAAVAVKLKGRGQPPISFCLQQQADCLLLLQAIQTRCAGDATTAAQAQAAAAVAAAAFAEPQLNAPSPRPTEGAPERVSWGSEAGGTHRFISTMSADGTGDVSDKEVKAEKAAAAAAMEITEGRNPSPERVGAESPAKSGASHGTPAKAADPAAADVDCSPGTVLDACEPAGLAKSDADAPGALREAPQAQIAPMSDAGIAQYGHPAPPPLQLPAVVPAQTDGTFRSDDGPASSNAGPLHRSLSQPLQQLYWEALSGDKIAHTVWASAGSHATAGALGVDDRDAARLEKLFGKARSPIAAAAAPAAAGGGGVDSAGGAAADGAGLAEGGLRSSGGGRRGRGRKRPAAPVLMSVAQADNIAIVLRALRRVGPEQLGLALADWNSFPSAAAAAVTDAGAASGVEAADTAAGATDRLSADELQLLHRCLPTDAELKVAAAFSGAVEELSPAERFLCAVAFGGVVAPERRLAALLLAEQFDGQLARIKAGLVTVMAAASQARGSARLRVILGRVLAIGNRLNAGTHKGNAAGFRFGSVLKLSHTKSVVDKKTTVLDFLVSSMAGEAAAGAATAAAAAGAAAGIAGRDQVFRVEALDLERECPDVRAAARLPLADVLAELRQLKRAVAEATEEVEAAEAVATAADAVDGAIAAAAAAGGGGVGDADGAVATVAGAAAAGEIGGTAASQGAGSSAAASSSGATAGGDYGRAACGLAKMQKFLTGARSALTDTQAAAAAAEEEAAGVATYFGEEGGYRASHHLFQTLVAFMDDLERAKHAQSVP